jgi:hypothetical protein
MTAIRIYLDENVHGFLADALKLRGWEASTTAEQGRLLPSDPDQIDFATAQGYAILTYDRGDFPRLHYERMKLGVEHNGILIGVNLDPHQTLRGLLRLLSEVTAEELKNRLEYLSNWI